MHFAMPALLLVILSWATAAFAGDQPFDPPPDLVLVERAALSQDPDIRALRKLRTTAARQPSDPVSAAAYARAAIDLGRERGDPRYFGFAQSAIAAWTDAVDPPQEIRLLRATLAQRDHRFDDARADLDPLVTSTAFAAQARLMLAVIDMVQGRPREGLAECGSLAPLVPRLVAATCAAQGASLTGDATRAQKTLLLAILTDREGDPGVRRWSLTLAAEIAARRGDTPAARRLFDSAFELEATDPLRRDVYLRAAWADLLLAQGDGAAVIAKLGGDAAFDPLLLRLALAERAAGQAGFAAHRDELAARFALARQRGDALHLREEARFHLDLADDAPGALVLALENWAKQREPADALLVLRAAASAHAAPAAAPVLDWMRETGIDDAALDAAAMPLRSAT